MIPLQGWTTTIDDLRVNSDLRSGRLFVDLRGASTVDASGRTGGGDLLDGLGFATVRAMVGDVAVPSAQVTPLGLSRGC